MMITRRGFSAGLLAIAASPARADTFPDILSHGVSSFGNGKNGLGVSGTLDLRGVVDATIRDSRFVNVIVLLDCKSKNITFDYCWLQEVVFPDVTLVQVPEGNGLRFIGCFALGPALDGFFDIAGPCEAVS